MKASRGNFDHATAQSNYVDRCRTICQRAVTQLTKLIVAPALHSARARKSARVKETCDDRSYAAAQADYIRWRRAIYRRAASKLSFEVFSPTLDSARSCKCASVSIARSYRNHAAAQSKHIHWCGAI